MPENTDTNQLAFDKLKALVEADASLSDAIKKALAQDCAVTPPVPAELKKIFNNADAPTK